MKKVDVVVVLRHLGIEREIAVLKSKGYNFHLFPPYAKKPFGSVDVHMSWHESGEEIVPSLVESGGSRFSARYATCSC